MKELKLIAHQMRELMGKGISFALATVVHVDGSAYRRPGARMLISSTGDWWGGISGGCLEGDMLKKAQYAMMSQSIQVVQYDTREDDPFELGVGLGCNGLIDILINPQESYLLAFLEMIEKHFSETSASILLSIISKTEALHQLVQAFSCPSNFSTNDWDACYLQGSSVFKESDTHYYFLERLVAKTRIWIFGNQFDSLRLIDQCEWLGWEVHWVGNPTKMHINYQAKVKQVYAWDDSYEVLPSDHLVLMTHDFERDTRLLTDLIPRLSPSQYIGLLGPHKRMDKLQKAIGSILNNDVRNQFFSPIGLDIGAQGPYEIAVAIIAEILHVTSGREIQSLRNRKGSINA